MVRRLETARCPAVVVDGGLLTPRYCGSPILVAPILEPAFAAQRFSRPFSKGVLRDNRPPKRGTVKLLDRSSAALKEAARPSLPVSAARQARSDSVALFKKGLFASIRSVMARSFTIAILVFQGTTTPSLRDFSARQVFGKHMFSKH